MVPVCVPHPALPVARANCTGTRLLGLKRLHDIRTGVKGKSGDETRRTTGSPYSAAVASTMEKKRGSFSRGPGQGLTLVHRFGEEQFSHREALDGDPLNRCSELKPRHSVVPLHLESCYTVETHERRLRPNALTAEASFAYPRVSGATDELTMSPMTATGSSTGGENNAKRWV